MGELRRSVRTSARVGGGEAVLVRTWPNRRGGGGAVGRAKALRVARDAVRGSVGSRAARGSRLDFRVGRIDAVGLAKVDPVAVREHEEFYDVLVRKFEGAGEGAKRSSH
jgi:hypothetical protein